eukprot:750917-Pyramimonas_sp.AAC.1
MSRTVLSPTKSSKVATASHFAVIRNGEVPFGYVMSRTVLPRQALSKAATNSHFATPPGWRGPVWICAVPYCAAPSAAAPRKWR